MYTVRNSKVSLSFDQMGNLVELRNLETDHNYAGGEAIWRLVCQRGQDIEYAVSPSLTKPEIEVAGERLLLRYDTLQTNDGEIYISCQIIAELCEDSISWSIELTNNHQGVVIRECFFPMVAACNIKDNQSLLWSVLGGQKFENPRDEIARHHTLYMGQDEDGIVMTAMYPGVFASMNFFAFANETEGLYFGSHDKSFQQTQHYFRLVNEVDLEAGMVKYPFLKAGESIKLDDYITSPYQGSWHIGAQKYGTWFNSFSTPTAKPDWLKDYNGWQRVIMKHQYGKVLFGYDEMEQIYRDGEPAGVDGTFLFGWHDDGHDAGYPDYFFDEKQGGIDAFRRGVKRIQEAGGKVLLYFNGHLIEQGGEYYNSIGRQISEKNERGLEYSEQYCFSGLGTIQRQFGNRVFVGACPACREWYVKLCELCDIAIELGVDSIFFDQMGGWDNVLCFDETHGHPVPFTQIGQAKTELLGRLREYVRTRAPQMGFGTEILCDITARQVDYVHNLWGACPASNPKWEENNQKPISIGFVELFRYVFPDIILSDREIRDDTDIPRRVNHAILKGLINDVEIYRCRNTIAAAPTYSEYLGRANALRKRHSDLLLAGRFCDSMHFHSDNPDVAACSFVAGDKMAIVLTQSHLNKAITVINADGYVFEEFDSIGEADHTLDKNSVTVKLPKHSLAVCVFSHK